MPESDPASAVAPVVAAVLASRRYRHVDPATVERIAREQLAAAGGRVPDAVKRSKRALHQVFGAYLPQPSRYARLTAQIEAATDEEARRAALRRAMAQHVSTRERLDYLDPFYETLREHMGQPASVLDLACGLGPLASPWLGLRPGAAYHAWDIDHALIEFVGHSLRGLGMEAHGAVIDLLAVPQWPDTEVALVLKTLPCLEQQRAGASEALLRTIPARRIVVSFPTRSLGGRAKGMGQTYARRFEQLLDGLGWTAASFEVGPELVYVVQRPSTPG